MIGALRQRFGRDVRPHWGQMMRDPEPGQIASTYPAYDRWHAIRDELDPKGCLLNDWQAKILPPIRGP
jgi:hypothetical protein